MERAAFLIERTGARLSCLLNPETLVVRRLAGVRPRRSVGGQLTGAGLADDPLLYTGGGTTELTLDLLFDITLTTAAKSQDARYRAREIETDRGLGELGGLEVEQDPTSLQLADDVRDLTRPLWQLAENAAGDDAYGRVPLVRFVWGKSWNIPGVVTAVAERYERFSPSGAPGRSWLRMRLLRVAEPAPETPPEIAPRLPQQLPEIEIPEDQLRIHELTGGDAGKEGGAPVGERLDQLAQRYYGDSAFWRVIAAFNNIEDPTRVPAATQLRIPPASAIGSAA